MKIENPLVFYPRYAWETVKKFIAYLRLYRELKAMLDESVARRSLDGNHTAG